MATRLSKRAVKKHMWVSTLVKEGQRKKILSRTFVHQLRPVALVVPVAHVGIPKCPSRNYDSYCLIQKSDSMMALSDHRQYCGRQCKDIQGQWKTVGISNYKQDWSLLGFILQSFPPSCLTEAGFCQSARKGTWHFAVVSLSVPLYVTQPLEHCS